MPIYEFQCQECHKEFQVLFRSFREKLEVNCSRCGSSKVGRLLSLFGFKSTSNHKGSSTGASCSSCSSKRCDTCNL